MPELPEVETIRRSLAPKLIGGKIKQAKVLLASMVQQPTVEELVAKVVGKTIIAVERRGKYFLLRLSDGLSLAIHLRMTGQLLVQDISEPSAKATYFMLALEDGHELRFSDLRKFGKVMLFKTDKPPLSLSKLGPEPLAADYTPVQLEQALSKRQVAIKKALLNQELVAGIGNIYADEALFVAGIHPNRPACQLTSAELNGLYQAIRQVLSESIEHRGTTKRDYRDGEGNMGDHQNYLRVYGRAGLPCPKCQRPIVKITLGGRGTHFCSKCQS